MFFTVQHSIIGGLNHHHSKDRRFHKTPIEQDTDVDDDDDPADVDVGDPVTF